MDGERRRRISAVRLVTPKEAEADPDWALETPARMEDRIAQVWELTLQSLAFAGIDDTELRLRRSVCEIQRVRR